MKGNLGSFFVNLLKIIVQRQADSHDSRICKPFIMISHIVRFVRCSVYLYEKIRYLKAHGVQMAFRFVHRKVLWTYTVNETAAGPAHIFHAFVSNPTIKQVLPLITPFLPNPTTCQWIPQEHLPARIRRPPVQTAHRPCKPHHNPLGYPLHTENFGNRCVS